MKLSEPRVWKSEGGKFMCLACKDGRQRDLRSALRHENINDHLTATSFYLAPIEADSVSATFESNFHSEIPSGPLSMALQGIASNSTNSPPPPCSNPFAPSNVHEPFLDFGVLGDERSNWQLEPAGFDSAVSASAASLEDWLADQRSNDGSSDDSSSQGDVDSDTETFDSEIALGRQHARYSKTFEKENPNWFPWPDKETCILDVLRHLPGSMFSQTQYETILWTIHSLGVNNVPTIDAIRSFEAEIQRRCGIRSLRFEGLWSFIPSYFNLKMFGQSYIIANARQLGFDNIIGFNAREKVLREAIKLKCSTARAQLRTNIIHTISGKKRYPLDRATVFLAEKLKRGGVTNKLKVEYILRVALLRRFASDDAQEDTRRGKQQHEQDEEDTAGDDSDGERPTKRKKKNTFWDRRDAYIADKIKRNGNQMDNAGWKLFLSNLVQQDIEQWGPLDSHIAKLQQKGFTLLPWDARNGLLLLDKQGHIFAGATSSRDPGWVQVTTDAFDMVSHTRRACAFMRKQLNHRRGRLPALARGISYGGGQQVPMALRSLKVNDAALSHLMDKPSIRHIAGLQSQLLHTFAPRLGAYYKETLNALLESQPGLACNFHNSDFACLTVNFGPNTICLDHTDFVNLATGLCAITALGDFDSKRGGHLIFWDLKLILEFPNPSEGTKGITHTIFCRRVISMG
ncbi:hypothetical protein PC9H_003103 [Pleurotus ostreatus]|uniref:Uncharacterized protein n=1 Tax=Pleurotus ostreatus TaxID=5322 RepID=A0A8H7A0T0_PLEOS|nr:uncharacterized protein PC9H_003103 [Pleurotus ostreatus]KAF7436274.1 hypothetical protein PC9H_003103 [Pleurotus ostreatus]